MSIATNTTPICHCPFSCSNLMIATNYSHTINIATVETSPNPTVKMATIDLRIHKWYILFVQTVKDFPPVTLDEGYYVSSKFTCKFTIPLVHLHSSLSTPLLCDSYVLPELLKFPINSGLAQYLKQ
ncbi:hypothetical protein SESBI_27787 [Sesbania bispinosa]|nr:hypothetical protein SESBI_27787 [Sesbania bispinosa]